MLQVAHPLCPRSSMDAALLKASRRAAQGIVTSTANLWAEQDTATAHKISPASPASPASHASHASQLLVLTETGEVPWHLHMWQARAARQIHIGTTPKGAERARARASPVWRAGIHAVPGLHEAPAGALAVAVPWFQRQFELDSVSLEVGPTLLSPVLRTQHLAACALPLQWLAVSVLEPSQLLDHEVIGHPLCSVATLEVGWQWMHRARQRTPEGVWVSRVGCRLA